MWKAILKSVLVVVMLPCASSWFGWNTIQEEVEKGVVEQLREIYKSQLLPLELTTQFHEYHSAALGDAYFDAKPMIMLVGQYSTGKTTFIRYAVQKDFPGMRIGPEPTTDSFVAVMHAENPGLMPGNALTIDPRNPFQSLSKFGNEFLNHFYCSTVDSKILEHISIIDTPGILASEKQRINRKYDLPGVLKWFGERVDRIVLMFDANKLDISDEFKKSIEALRGFDDKIRIVLNKADSVAEQELMRVYGALMWSLGRVLHTPEVPQVYITSLWEKRLRSGLFEDEARELFIDLETVVRFAVFRKLNDLTRRARLVKVHAYILNELKKKSFHNSKKDALIPILNKIYDNIQLVHGIPPEDFPNIEKFAEDLGKNDFSKIVVLNQTLVDFVNHMLDDDLPKLLVKMKDSDVNNSRNHSSPVNVGIFTDILAKDSTPFGSKEFGGLKMGADGYEWNFPKAEKIMEGLCDQNGKVSEYVARNEMQKSKLPGEILAQVWKLADLNKDGILDCQELALALQLINIKLEGHDLPDEMPLKSAK